MAEIDRPKQTDDLEAEDLRARDEGRHGGALDVIVALLTVLLAASFLWAVATNLVAELF